MTTEEQLVTSVVSGLLEHRLASKMFDNKTIRRHEVGVKQEATWGEVDEASGRRWRPIPDPSLKSGHQVILLFGDQWPIHPLDSSLLPLDVDMVCFEHIRRYLQGINYDAPWWQAMEARRPVPLLAPPWTDVSSRTNSAFRQAARESTTTRRSTRKGTRQRWTNCSSRPTGRVRCSSSASFLFTMTSHQEQAGHQT